ncbi:hypothetical protein V3C99_003677 [Haemonchus contortus]
MLPNKHENSAKCSCPVCGREIHKHSFYRHLKLSHKYSAEQCLQLKNERLKTATSPQCPLCYERVVDQEALAIHCSNSHSEDGACGKPQNYSVFVKEFSNEQSFKVWLLEECKKTCTGLWQRSKDDTKSGRKIRLRCNRAGQNRNTAKIRIRTSRKENPYCSCFLNVEYRKDGKVTAKGCFGHVGHELDPALLHLTADQQEYLKTLLEDYPVSHIIRRVREENRERKSRLSFVSRSDLFNLKKRHQITPRYRNIDRSSVKMSPTSIADDIYEDHREQGQRKLNEIMNTWATLETQAKYLADSGSLDSMKKLDSILEHLKLATANIPSANSLYPPESVKNGVEAHAPYVESSPKQRQVNPKTRTVRNLLQRNRLMTDSSPARVPGPSWN